MTTLGRKLSSAGSILSLVCAVHCAFTPLALLALPLLAAHYGGAMAWLFGVVFSESAEWVFLGVVVGISGLGALVTYPIHRDRRPAMLTMIGFLTLLLVRAFVEEGSSWALTGDVLGASIIAWGGFVNCSLCRCAPCHGRADNASTSFPVSAGP